VDNSIDETLAGYCTHIEVDILEGNIIRVADNGRGIPTGINQKYNKPAVTMVFTMLHAGGKFGGSGYKVSGGLHGVGASVVNALSSWLEVEVHDGKRIVTQRFEKGDQVTELVEKGPCSDTGTIVTFQPDPTIFTDTVEYDYDILLTRLREQAFLNGGVKITLTDRREEGEHRQDLLHFEGGIRSYVDFIMETSKKESTLPNGSILHIFPLRRI
jgi:DNA gyrase subunit B